MDRPTNTILRVGAWRVDPASGEISREGETARLEARTMRLLLCLAQRPGEVVSIEELLDQAWSGVTVSSDSVYQAVASLRRQLGDDPKQPSYIATVPRLGYRMLASVSPWTDSSDGQAESGPATSAGAREKPASHRTSAIVWAVAGALALAVVIAFLLYRGSMFKNQAAQASLAVQPAKSIAVLPFLDLTPGMKEEEFADGLTEEIIDKASKVEGFRVPAATASFYYKYKKIPVAEIARTLGVIYILDGSTRQSGDHVRIAARLVRGENGYVIWSQTYDRPFVDRVAVQDEIAGEVTKAIRASMEAAASPGQSAP
jgi:TolB-like protein/DNA-binding winged helix-turn-helix (wHTH) protein